MFRALRVVAVLTAISLFLQPVLAGYFLSGNDGMIDAHQLNGMLVVTLGFVQAVIAVVCFRKRLVPVDKVAGPAMGMFVLEVVELSVGFSHTLWLHIPIGVALVGGTAVLLNDLKAVRLTATADAGADAVPVGVAE